MECKYEGCTNAVRIKKYMLCDGHYMQQKRGKTLKPLRGRAHNRKYEDARPCKIEDCDREVHANGMCSAHDYQNRKYGYTWPVGTPRPGKTYQQKEGRWNGYMGSEYTPTRTCERCGETKEWQRFCLGTEHMKNVCRDCNRKALSDMALEGPTSHHSSKKKKNGMEDLLAFLNARTGQDATDLQ